MIWCSGQTDLFLLLLVRAAPASFPTALSVVLRPLFPFRQAQYAQVFPLMPAPFCTLFAGLGSTNKSVVSFHFSYYLTLVLSSPPCPLLRFSFYLKLCGRSGRNCFLSPALSGYNGSSDTRFSWGTTRLMSWPDGEHYSSYLSYSLLSYLGLEAYCLIEILRHPCSLDFHRGTLVILAVFFRLRCNEHSLLLSSYLSRIGRIENASCSACGHSSQDISFCTVQEWTLCATHFLATLYDLWS